MSDATQANWAIVGQLKGVLLITPQTTGAAESTVVLSGPGDVLHASSRTRRSRFVVRVCGRP